MLDMINIEEEKGVESMQFEVNAEVNTVEGHKVGTLNRVVIDPKTKEITHLVVSGGLLPAKERVVPVSLAVLDNKGRVVLSVSQDEYDELPEFEITHFLPAGAGEAIGNQNSLYWYPPILAPGQTGRMIGYSTPPYVRKTERAIPDGMVALEEGAQVLSREGQSVGSVESVRIREDDKASHLVISGGILLKKRKLIPTHWISHIKEDKIHLSVGSGLIDRLPENNS